MITNRYPVYTGSVLFLLVRLVLYLANGRDLLGCAAGAVVLPVCEAGEHLRVPGRADHQVGHARLPHALWVTELVHAPVQAEDV
jgi:hypothetical protein